MQQLLSRIRDQFTSTRQLLAIVLAFSVFVRLGSLRVINNPDAVHKWAAARALFHGASLPKEEFNHHAARWGVNLPTLAAQLLFGDDVRVYYVPTLALTTLLAWLTFSVGKELSGKWTGALAVFLYTPLPALSYTGSQLMPELFQSCYVMGALLCVVRWYRRNCVGLPWASLLWFCAAYLAKESAVFFLPGLLLAVWLAKRRLREVLFYGAGFGVLLGLETLAYRLSYGFPWGRLSIVAQHHLKSPKMKPPIESVSELLVRYLELKLGIRELFFSGLTLSLVLPFVLRKRRVPAFCLLSVCWSFFLASTFALKSIDPPQIVQPLNERYLHAGAPFLALVVALFSREALSRLRDLLPLRDVLVRPASIWLLRRAVPLAALGCAIVATAVWVHRSPPGHEHAITTMARYQRLLRDAYEQGLPLVSRDMKRNATFAATDLFLSFEQSKRVKIAYLNGKLKRKASSKARGVSKVRVLVDGDHRRYANVSEKQLNGQVRNWAQEEHIQFSMMKGFHATRVKTPRSSNGLATTR